MSAQTLQEGQIQSLQNVKQLQDVEKGLYKQLEAAVAANSDSATQQQIIAQIDKIKEMRESQFAKTTTMYNSLKQNVSSTLNNFIDEMSDSIVIVQDELDKSKIRIDKVEEIKNNKQRMAEINTYYSKQYKEDANTLKTFMYFCVPIIVLLVLKKNEVLPEIILNMLITIISVVGGFVIIRKLVINTFLRDNMDYDEVNQILVPDQVGPTVLEYDEQQLKNVNVIDDINSDANYLASKLGFACIGSSCCSTGMTFDSDQKKCVLVKPFNSGVNAQFQQVPQ